MTDVISTDSPQRGVLTTLWLRFALAVTFLTRLPLPVRGEVRQDDLRASTGWYPLVGLGIGAVGWGIYRAASLVVPPSVAAVLVVMLLQMFTGALHLDGFMDTCDGLGSGAPRERALEIMKDSRVGAMGVFGAIAVLLLKVTALAALTVPSALVSLLVGWAAARAVPAWDVAMFPYARATGTGRACTGGGRSWGALIAATLTALAVGYGLGSWHGLAFAVLLVLLPLLVQLPIARKLGGLTGDTYGMGIELAEALALLIGCAFL